MEATDPRVVDSVYFRPGKLPFEAASYHLASGMGGGVGVGGGCYPCHLLGKGSVRQGWGDWLQAELPAGSFSPAETDQAPDLLGPAPLPPWGNPAPSTSPLPGAEIAASHLDAW